MTRSREGIGTVDSSKLPPALSRVEILKESHAELQKPGLRAVDGYMPRSLEHHCVRKSGEDIRVSDGKVHGLCLDPATLAIAACVTSPWLQDKLCEQDVEEKGGLVPASASPNTYRVASLLCVKNCSARLDDGRGSGLCVCETRILLALLQCSCFHKMGRKPAVWPLSEDDFRACELGDCEAEGDLQQNPHRTARQEEKTEDAGKWHRRPGPAEQCACVPESTAKGHGRHQHREAARMPRRPWEQTET